MTNLLLTIGHLLASRRGGKWTDEGVGAGLMELLGLDPNAVPAHLVAAAGGAPAITVKAVMEAHDAASDALKAYHDLEAKFALQVRPVDPAVRDTGAEMANDAAQAAHKAAVMAEAEPGAQDPIDQAKAPKAATEGVGPSKQTEGASEPVGGLPQGQPGAHAQDAAAV